MLLPDLVLGRNVAARFGPRTECCCKIWSHRRTKSGKVGPNLAATFGPRNESCSNILPGRTEYCCQIWSQTKYGCQIWSPGPNLGRTIFAMTGQPHLYIICEQTWPRRGTVHLNNDQKQNTFSSNNEHLYLWDLPSQKYAVQLTG